MEWHRVLLPLLNRWDWFSDGSSSPCSSGPAAPDGNHWGKIIEERPGKVLLRLLPVHILTGLHRLVVMIIGLCPDIFWSVFLCPKASNTVLVGGVSVGNTMIKAHVFGARGWIWMDWFSSHLLKRPSEESYKLQLPIWGRVYVAWKFPSYSMLTPEFKKFQAPPKTLTFGGLIHNVWIPKHGDSPNFLTIPSCICLSIPTPSFMVYLQFPHENGDILDVTSAQVPRWNPLQQSLKHGWNPFQSFPGWWLPWLTYPPEKHVFVSWENRFPILFYKWDPDGFYIYIYIHIL